MTFKVLWVPQAKTALARVSMQLDFGRRKVIIEILSDIERRLRARPFEEGESREGSDRILIQPPLAIRFEVSKADQVVHILDVWQFRVGPNKS